MYPARLIFAIVLIFLFSGVSVSAESVVAQSGLEKATREVQAITQTLATTKDAKEEDLAFRIETYKKVVNLALANAEERKIALVLRDRESAEAQVWLTRTLSRVDEIITRLKTEQKNDFTVVATPEAIKKLAADLRDWKETLYDPLIAEVDDFLAVEKSERVLSIALERVNKVTDDIIKIEKAGITTSTVFRDLLKRATSSLSQSAFMTESAREMFRDLYIEPLLEKEGVTGSKTATSSRNFFDENMDRENENPATTTATDRTTVTSSLGMSKLSVFPTTDVAAPSVFSGTSSNPVVKKPYFTTAALSTNTLAGETRGASESSVLSIKDLVKESFAGIRVAYQAFIEMSNLVRKLL